jgi:hypothetical protein
MPKRNYGYEKRQKELNRQRKQEEKRQRKLDRSGPPTEGEQEDVTAPLDGPPKE